jgi:hypothetical protein
MKNFVKWFGIISMALVVAFSFAACDDGSTGGGGGGPRTVTYSGTAGSGSYSLKIIEKANNPNRAVLNDPLPGDNFEFTWTDDANKTKKSAGQVESVSGNEFTMLPANAETKQTTFTTTVSDEGLTAMSGTFTWTDGTTNTGSGTLTPSGGPGNIPGGNIPGGGGGGKITWTRVADSTFGESTDYIYAIAYGGNKFVAGSSSGKMAYSSDGITWTAVTTTALSGNTYTDCINAIAYGGGKFVAVGNDGKITYSPDGVNWTAVTTTVFDFKDIWGDARKAGIISIAYGNGMFVAGSNGYAGSGGGGGKMAYSSDGVDWTAVLDTKFDKFEPIAAIAYGNGKFIAGGYEGKTAYSSDGITWTKGPDGILGTYYMNAGNPQVIADIIEIAFGNGKFVAGSSSGKMAYSSNGVNWTVVTDSPGILGEVPAIAYGNGKFIAYVHFGTQGVLDGKLASSTDGANWTVIESLYVFDTTFATEEYYAIAFGNGKFVIGGRKGEIVYSTGN